MSSADLLVLLKGDVPTDHVVEQNPQGPDGGRAAVVTVELDPLGGAVDPRACQENQHQLVKNILPSVCVGSGEQSCDFVY